MPECCILECISISHFSQLYVQYTIIIAGIFRLQMSQAAPEDCKYSALVGERKSKRGSNAGRPLMTAVGGFLALATACLPLGGCALLQHTSARGWAALRPPRAGGRERAP